MNSRSLLAARVLFATLLLSLVGCGGGRDEPIIEDDFGTPDGTWESHVGDESVGGYAGGAYFLEVARSNWFAWVRSPDSYRDAQIEIKVQLESGPYDGHAGVLCRMEDDGAFYYMAISSDGYYGIFRRVDSGPLEAINAAGAMIFSSAIRTGNEPNHLSVRCEADQLSLSANDVLLESVTDGTLRKGRIGFGAGSGRGGTVRMVFDDLVLYSR